MGNYKYTYLKIKHSFPILLPIILLILFAFPSPVQADVPIQYPWFFGYDKNLPGIPLGDELTDIPFYSSELVGWGQMNGFTITSRNAGRMLMQPSPLIFEANGVVNSGANQDIPIWQFMRDVIFLETVQNSIKYWNQQYIAPLGNNQEISASSAYNRAKRIADEYAAYVEKCQHNPFVVASLGTGDFSKAAISLGMGKIKKIPVDLLVKGEINLEFTGKEVIKLFIKDFANNLE